jgi:hypothetical protein
MVNVADRGVGEKFSATVNRTSVSPIPDGALSETQLASLLAVHEHTDVVRIRTVAEIPAEGTESEPDASWNVHGTGGGTGGGGVGAGGLGAGGVGAGGAGAGGVGAGGAGAGGAGAGGGGGGGVAALGSCDNMTLCPATVTAADRGAGFVLAVTTMWTVPSPLPDAGDVDIQGTGDATVQLHRACVRMSIVRSPPAAGAVVSAAATE